MTEQILAVQRMQDYIEKNKTEEISLSDLVRASLFSPWYAYRLFRDCLGLTPTEYIRKYRLTQAAKQLRRGEVRVIDAALDSGFSNADTFTRAFFREFGLNPSDYMKNPVPITFFIPYGAKYRELRKENIDVSNIQPIFIQVVRKPERLCIIKRGRQAADYFPLPEAEYLMFRGPAFREEDYCEAIRTVQAAMDSYDPSVVGYRWDDENPRIQLEPRGGRGYIELRAVRRVTE